MILVISPAKTLDFESDPVTSQHYIPDSLDRSERLIKKLRTLSKKKIGELMGISKDLSQLNFDRYAIWSPEFDPFNSRIAIQAFKGDVYVGLDVGTFTPEDLDFAQQHLRILSGLHGVLRPLDAIKPYRLEMGTRLPVARKKNLYEFWKEEVTTRINGFLKESDSEYLINLASDEYFNAIDQKKLNGQIIKPVFKELKKGEYKVISFLAKKARGMMSAYMIKHRLSDPESLKKFDVDGYAFNEEFSNNSEWVFTRNSGL